MTELSMYALPHTRFPCQQQRAPRARAEKHMFARCCLLGEHVGSTEFAGESSGKKIAGACMLCEKFELHSTGPCWRGSRGARPDARARLRAERGATIQYAV